MYASRLGPGPEVVIEATYGWYWVVDLLQELGQAASGQPEGIALGERAAAGKLAEAMLVVAMRPYPRRALIVARRPD